MKALIIIDAQNEFSARGKRPVPNHSDALEVIKQRAEEARRENRPIAWVRHHNRPDESAAFVPNTWGTEFSPGLGPKPDSDREVELVKHVYGAFTGTDIGAWLKSKSVDEVLIVGFYTHGCVSTTAREAIMAGLDVHIDPNGTGACDMAHESLGELTADEVRRSALLQLANMGVHITPLPNAQTSQMRAGVGRLFNIANESAPTRRPCRCRPQAVSRSH
ncbi:MAG: cysteine hydrolase [Chthoniobacterales bacterium]|nr:cysteine hydrolase [Chthoniobacterales bacterium]